VTRPSDGAVVAVAKVGASSRARPTREFAARLTAAGQQYLSTAGGKPIHVDLRIRDRRGRIATTGYTVVLP
jgi:hypothetical protein